MVSSRRLIGSLARSGIGIADTPEAADILVVNTCGFIEAASEESIDVILELAQIKKNGNQKLVAVGCLAERYGEDLLASLPELDACLGLERMNSLSQIIGITGPKGLPVDHQLSPSTYLEITAGCDHGCSYCTIPAIHGSFRSRPEAEVIKEAGKLVAGGARELVLVGQETGAYGRDFSPPKDLAALLSTLSVESGADWLRVLYLQWYHINDDFLATMAKEAVINDYLDIPVQHASAKIVRSMNRRGSAGQYLKRLDKVREYLPEASLRTTVMVGFPGETERDILDLGDFLRAACFDYVGVFEYSAETGTPAADFAEQVSSAEKHDRADQIRLLADEIGYKRLMRHQGRHIDVLLEDINGDQGVGRSRFQAPEIDGQVQVDGVAGCRVGDLVRVRVAAVDGYDLKGSIDA